MKYSDTQLCSLASQVFSSVQQALTKSERYKILIWVTVMPAKCSHPKALQNLSLTSQDNTQDSQCHVSNMTVFQSYCSMYIYLNFP